MEVISIINQKGGVAKTTTTRNMAYALASKFGKKVLLIDMDDSGNLSESFRKMPPEAPGDIQGTYELAGVAQLLCDRSCSVDSVIEPTEYENIDIIPCNVGLAGAKVKIETDQMYPMQYRLSSKLKQLSGSDKYDFCLIDTKAGLDALVVNALVASDSAIIPTTVDKDSLLMVSRAIDAIEQISDYSAVALRGVLFTMVNTRTSLERQGITVLCGSLPYPVFDTYIRQSSAVRQTRWTYQMCDEGSKGSPAAMDYDNFVSELLGKPPLHKDGASRKAFIERENKKAEKARNRRKNAKNAGK